MGWSSECTSYVSRLLEARCKYPTHVLAASRTQGLDKARGGTWLSFIMIIQQYPPPQCQPSPEKQGLLKGLTPLNLIHGTLKKQPPSEWLLYVSGILPPWLFFVQRVLNDVSLKKARSKAVSSWKKLKFEIQVWSDMVIRFVTALPSFIPRWLAAFFTTEQLQNKTG